MAKYNVYKVNEETGEILELLVSGITDITPYKDGVYDKEGFLVTLNKETREEIERELNKRSK